MTPFPECAHPPPPSFFNLLRYVLGIRGGTCINIALVVLRAYRRVVLGVCSAQNIQSLDFLIDECTDVPLCADVPYAAYSAILILLRTTPSTMTTLLHGHSFTLPCIHHFMYLYYGILWPRLIWLTQQWSAKACIGTVLCVNGGGDTFVICSLAHEHVDVNMHVLHQF